MKGSRWYPAWFPHVLSIELRKILYYRADFWLNFIGGAGSYIVVFYFLWKAIFAASGATSMGGFTFDQMILYYSLVPLVDRCVRGQDMGSMSPEIYDGTLTRYLVYPLSFFGYKYVAHLALALIGFVQLFIGLGIYFLIFKMPAGIHLDTIHVLEALIAILFAGALYFLLTSALEMVAFWADNVWSLLVMLRFTAGILGGSMLPLSLFPRWARLVLEILPFSYLTSFPIRTFTGKVGMSEWTHGIMVLFLWIIAFWAVCRILLRRGLLKYTGVGI